MEEAEKGDIRNVKFSIGAKLVFIISVLTIFSLGIITLLVTWFGGQDVRISAEENNRTVNAQAASLAEKDLSSLRANAFLLLDILNRTESSSSFAKKRLIFILSAIRRLPPFWLPIRGGRAAWSESF